MRKHSAITDQRLHNLVLRLEETIYTRSELGLSISAWSCPGEPVPFAEALRASYQPFAVGQEWGPLWGTTWFRFRGTLPKSWKGRECVALIRLTTETNEGFSAEGLIYRDGQIVRALNINRSEVPLTSKATGGEKFEFLIEAAANTGTNPDGSINRVELKKGCLFRLEEAVLAVVDRQAESLYFDVRVAFEAMQTLPEHSTRRARLQRVLNEAANLFDSEGLTAAAAMRSLLKPILALTNGPSVHRVSVVGHAHIDTAWLWPLRETIRKCARTFSTMVDYMDRYPEFIFACSQPQQLAWMKALYPEIYARIKSAVKAGQWEPVGSMWVEPDCNLPSGESLIRQVLQGKRWFQDEFGIETKDCWIPDVFGYPATLPQILAGCGVDSFLTQKISWNQFNRFPHHTFWWEGLDGTKIFSHFPPCDTYNAFPSPALLAASVEKFQDHGRSDCSLMPVGYGDGGGGPTEGMFEYIRRLKNFEGLPPVAFSSVAGFFKKAKASAVDLQTWAGELYLEMHRGTLTTQAQTKRGNRKSELLLREAELFDAVSALLVPSRAEKAVNPGRALYDVPCADEHLPHSHRGALGRAWRLTLLNQFHDILPGSSIARVYEDAARDYATIAELAGSVLQGSLRVLEDRIDTAGYKKPIVVFNPLGFRRREVAELPDGRPALLDVPPCGYAVIESDDPSHQQTDAPVRLFKKSSGLLLENGQIRLQLDRKGRLISLFDLEENREVLAAGSRGNELRLYPDFPNNYDAWDVDAFQRETVEVLDDLTAMEVVINEPLRAVVRLERKFGRSRVSQEVVIRAGSKRIDFVTEVDWREDRRLLKVAFPVAIRSPQATYEIQFGHVERPTHENTSWDLARFEVCGHRWADLSEHGYGVALLNDCKYGYCIQGQEMELSLLRAPVNPDPAADRGHHTFTYSILPHRGTFQEAGVIEQAQALNTPLRLQAIRRHEGGLPSAESFFDVDQPNVVIDTIKRAEDSDDLIVRLYEAHGRRGEVSLKSSLPLKSASLTDLLERPKRKLPWRNQRVKLRINPFEIVTLRLST